MVPSFGIGLLPIREVNKLLDYLMINALTILFPVLLSFDRRVHFYRKVGPILASIAVISPVYIIWDAIATHRGDWSFNSDYVRGVELLGLPLEEVLFFVTVPYACIFIYECLLYYVGDAPVAFRRTPYLVAAGFLVALATAFYDQYYTATVLVFSAAFLVITALWYDWILRSRVYWTYLVLTVVPFVVVNYFLTSIPIVEYSGDAIWGTRMTTIPAEDFIYNYSMLSFYLLAFLAFKRRWGVDADNEDVPVEVGTGRGLGTG